jgi:uncharacterized membrane protein YidH (DUF202 family)
MSNKPSQERPRRPARIELPPLPPLPQVSAAPDVASVEYSTHRTKLSTLRTGLSEHRTDLSEYRTDLSSERTEMSMRRTGMSFQRTRMSADRTLMSVIRTSLSLIGFGFTIFQTFQKLHDAGTIGNPNAPRNFGIALVLLGIVMLIVGMVHHVQFMVELRHTRRQMMRQGLVYGRSRFPVSITFMVSVGLLLLGVAAIADMVFSTKVFG